MTEVLRSPSSSSSSSPSLPIFRFANEEEEEEEGGISLSRVADGGEEGVKERDQLSLLALLLTLFRKSFWVACKTGREDQLSGMEIGWPTNVRHVAHVTFDRFNGFLGLPVEFEPEVPRRAPSASATVFGVSTESMQLSYDSRGNSIPTILLLMQQRLYEQGGLQAEGIFRINAENSQEEYVRNQLNRGVVPDGIDVHCLAGLIKAWFRELPTGVLDPLSPERVMQCQSEEASFLLVRLLPPTETALLNWAINLMADVVQQEHLNKMNAHNIAMVFAPNMTQMADPLNALMYAVQVMNFLKTLITRTLREREDSSIEPNPVPHLDPFDENNHQGSFQPCRSASCKEETKETEQAFFTTGPHEDTTSDSNRVDNMTDEDYLSYSTSAYASDGDGSCATPIGFDFTPNKADGIPRVPMAGMDSGLGQSSNANLWAGLGKMIDQKLVPQATGAADRNRGISNLSRINSLTERIEAWR